MASTSGSSIQNSFKYDVFLSFRGEDTRKNFVDHLYHALKQKSIETYKDDEKIKQGKMISDELIKAIENSKLYIIILSKNYASSSWCLEELVKIMECRKGFGHTAYPVFYDVEPTEVRKQTGSVGDAFAKHKEHEAAGKWREALKEASDLAGWELKSIANGHEAKFIQKIVEEISLELRFINSDVDGKLIGMETRVNDAVSSLETSVDDVRMLGIWGMGGAGKTTLARAVFDRISIQFEGQSFVENVREISKTSSSGLKKLQKQVLSDVLNDNNIRVSSVSDGKNMMKKFLHSRKVLVVVDDVDHIEQLEALTVRNWFKPGSTIIITTRDEQVLRAHGVNSIHGVNLLSKDEAIFMFRWYAFGKEIEIEGYKELSMQVVRYAAGLPLTIKVLGSFLCGKDEIEWKDAIERLKTIPLEETLKKLELSYDSLEQDYKEIFLDVACLFKGQKEDEAIQVLESQGFHAKIGLRVLKQKSLITISKYGSLGMHDHLEEMGKNIVRRLYPDEPNKHSRLWIDEEIEDILTNDLGTQATKCIYFYPPRGFSAEIAVKGLAKMKDLRFIHIYLEEDDYDVDNIVEFDKDSEYLPSSLRFMRWRGFPFLSLPNTFQGKYLVGIEMSHSKIVQLWEDGEEKVLHKLRFLTLYSCSKLQTFDLRLARNLEQLTIEECRDFVELHIPADHHSKLEYLTLRDTTLTNLHLGNTPNLKRLILKHCSDLVELQMPAESLKLEHLDLSHSELKTIHLGNTPNLKTLEISYSKIVQLWEGGEEKVLHKLRFLKFYSSKLQTFDLRLAPNLEQLTILYCHDFEELHIPADHHSKLEYLTLTYSKLTNLHLGNTPNLKRLILKGCYNLVYLQMPAESSKLEHLDLSDSKLKTVHLGNTPNLKTLKLIKCYDLVELQMPDESLKLEHLELSHSKLTNLLLGNTPNLKILVLKGCNDLVEFQMPAERLKLEYIDFSDTKLKTLDLGLTSNLEWLKLKNCYDLVEINAPIGCGRFKSFEFDKCPEHAFPELHLIAEPTDVCPLHSDNDSPKFLFECYYLEVSASSFGNLERLISIGLCACTNLESFSRSICSLQGLRKLTLEGSITEAPRDLDQLECLEGLTFTSTEIRNLPDSICKLKQLKSFKIKSCWLLEKLPEDIGRLESLEKLILTDCKLLQAIPNSICKMKCINKLHLRGCIQVVELPEDIGCLEGPVSRKQLPLSSEGDLKLISPHLFSCALK
ncbi:disease resistance protein (TIR-NBS-LRR class) [Artemisia annua]|uniref:Disease resistance protein (TIR-NBS-LRR class) n=1 Tax=Artemisia annua TaxID=35608 RepID=A0A2U1PSP4_ARTAN|nr:disease resistance protein (TIR-NBS-LRR class) [Artemisia annua]